MDRPAVIAIGCAVALAVATTAGAQDRAPAAPRAASVELRLPPGEDPAAAAGLVAVASGDAVSAAALRRTVQRLFQTGRYRNVVVRESPASPPQGQRGAWVRVVIDALPVRIVQAVDVRIEGASPLDLAAIRAAARIAPGEPFDEDDLEPASARIRAALARKGWRDAAVAATAQGDRPVVALAIRPGEPVRVAAIRLGGAPGLAEAKLRAALRTRVGAVLDADVLDADVRALRSALHAAGYRRSRVAPPAVRVEGAHADVEFPVEAGPRIAFVFRGNEDIASSTLSRQLGFEEGQPVDVPAVAAAAERLRAFYRARGYAAGRVETDEVARGRDLAIVFHVDEGRRYGLRPVRFEGASYRSERWLRERLAALLDEDAPEPEMPEADAARALALSVPGARARPAPPPALAPHEVWDEEAWTRAAQRLVDEYRADGFLEAVHLGGSVALDERRGVAEPVVRLREGVRTHVEAIAFEGNEVVSLPALAREARLAPGDPLVYEKVEATRAALLRIYLARGYIYARVEALEDVDRERHLAVVRFAVREGPKVRIGRILVSGNRRTREDVVRGALALAEGDVYDPDAIAKSQAALLRLGVFRSVGLRLQDPEVPQETKDLAVEVSERPWATLSQGIGFSIANGPRGVIEYGQPNLLGRALELSARGKVNYPLVEFRPDLAGKSASDRIEGRVDVGLRAPSLDVLPLATAGRAGLVGEVLHRRAYDLRRASASTGVDVGLTSRASFSLQYELEVDRIFKSSEEAFLTAFLTTADRDWLRFPDGVTTIHSVRPTLSVDYRDNSAHPHRGWLATGTVEYAQSLGGKGDQLLFGLLPGSDYPTNMIKASGTASSYMPVGPATVVALSLRGGQVFPLSPDSRTIIPRRFFLGGATTMRGYAEEEMIPQDVREAAHACAANPTAPECTDTGRTIAGGERPVSEGGEAFVLAKAELRLRLHGSLEAGLFADIGNLWLDPSKVDVLNVRTNVGFGIRFVTPIGPAALDIGFNVDPDRTLNERIVAPHFTIGLF